MKHATFLSLFALVAGGLLQPEAGAQQPAPHSNEPQKWLAHRMNALALQALEHASNPQAGVGAASVLLSGAEALSPDEPVWAWRLFELSELRGQSDRARDSLGRYLRFRPGDDAAQWRYIQMLLRGRGGVAERVALIDRMLEHGEADALGSALRGRLSLQSALLSRENGDRPAYLSRLQQALKLDPACSDAHTHLYRLLREENRPVSEQISALLLLLETRPLDPGIRDEGAQWLMRCGQYGSAARWFEACARLAGPGESLAPIIQSWAAALWGAGEDAGALALLENLLQAGPPDPALLSLRALIHQAAGREPEAEAAFAQLQAHLVAERQKAPQDLRLVMDQLRAHVLFGRRLEEADALIDLLTQRLSGRLPQDGRLYGWWLLRRGRHAEAAELLERSAAEDAMSAYGLALAKAEGGEVPAEQIRSIYLQEPDSLLGIYLARQLAARGAVPVLGGDCSEVTGLLGAVPQAVLVPEGSLVRLSVSSDHRRIRFAEPVTFQVHVTNRWRVPLEVGGAGAISSRVWIEPQLQIGADRPQVLPGFWIDIDRRLRLGPGESAGVDFAAGSAALGEAFWSHPAQPVKIRLRAVLNPVADDAGQVRSGPGGAEMLGDWIEREAVAPDDASLQAMLSRIPSAPPEEVMSILAGLIRLVSEPGPEHPRGREISRWLSSGFPQLSETMQAWVVAAVPPTDSGYRAFGPILQQAQAGGGERVRQALVAAHWERSAPGWLEKIGLDGRSERLQELCSLLAEARRKQPQGGDKPDFRPSGRQVDR